MSLPLIGLTQLNILRSRKPDVTVPEALDIRRPSAQQLCLPLNQQ